MKHVSHHDAEHLERNPFPELHRPPSEISPQTEAVEKHPAVLKSKIKHTEPVEGPQRSDSDVRMFRQNEANAEEQVKHKYTDAMPSSHPVSEKPLDARDQDKTVIFPCFPLRETDLVSSAERYTEYRYDP